MRRLNHGSVNLWFQANQKWRERRSILSVRVRGTADQASALAQQAVVYATDPAFPPAAVVELQREIGFFLHQCPKIDLRRLDVGPRVTGFDELDIIGGTEPIDDLSEIRIAAV